MPDQRRTAPTEEVRAAIVKAVADGFDEQIAFARRLVAFPSTRGAEHAIRNLLFRAFGERGYSRERFAMEREAIARPPGGARWSDTHSEAPIIVAIHRPRAEAGRSLILQSHVDVVPAGPRKMWASDPFEARIAEGYVLDPSLEAEAVLGRAHGAATGESLESFTTPGYLDTRVYALYDRISALCDGPVSHEIH